MVRPGRDRLSGIVEVDEAYLGGERSGKPGRGALGKTLILVAVEASQGKTGRIRLKRIKDASAAILNAAIEDCVEPGSAVRTDGWSGYHQLAPKGFVHSVARPHAVTGKLVAQGQPGCVTSQKVAAGHSSGSGSALASRLLPRRIHLLVQPADLQVQRQAFLPPSPTGSCRSAAYRLQNQRRDGAKLTTICGSMRVVRCIAP